MALRPIDGVPVRACCPVQHHPEPHRALAARFDGTEVGSRAAPLPGEQVGRSPELSSPLRAAATSSRA